MLKRIAVLVLVIIISACGYLFWNRYYAKPESFASAPGRIEEQELINLFKKYHSEKNIAGLLSLYCFDGTPDSTKKALTDNFQKTMASRISSIELENIEDDSFAYLEDGYVGTDGKIMIGNGKPLKQLSIQYDAGNEPEESRHIEHILPVGFMNGGYVILSVKYAPDSMIHKISIKQLTDVLQVISANKAKWPLAIASAENVFSRNSQLPDGYQEILRDFKTKEYGDYVDYTLYEFNEPGFYQRRYHVTLAVHKQTGILRRPVVEIGDIPIYDRYLFIKEDGGEPGASQFISAKELKPVGGQLGISKLTSTASVATCDSIWTDQVLSTLKTGYKPTGELHDGSWTIITVKDLIPIQCATIDYPAFSIAIQYYLLDAENSDQYVIGNRLVWIAKYDKGSRKLADVVYSGISNNSDGDIITDLHVAAIADINDDGYHDIILNDSHYMRTDFITLLYDQNGIFYRNYISIASSGEVEEVE